MWVHFNFNKPNQPANMKTTFLHNLIACNFNIVRAYKSYKWQKENKNKFWGVSSTFDQ